MKNLSQFKKAIKVGVKLHCIYHLGHTELRGEDGKPLFKDIDNGIREVSISQTNSFALKTKKIKEDSTEKWTDSWFQYPKASDCEFPGNNIVVVYEEDRDDNKFKVLTYQLVDYLVEKQQQIQ